MPRIQCAVLGATGMVGQRFVRLLDGHPDFEAILLAASERRKGAAYGDDVRWLLEGKVPEYARNKSITSLDPDLIVDSGVKLAFSALPADVAGPMETELASKGVSVFSNAASHRMDTYVPILVPEVNHDHLSIINGQETPGKIITNANCSTTGLVMGLEPIRPLRIKRVIVTTFQALSGAGYPGISSMDIIGNVVPYIQREEEKMIAETKHIMGFVNGNSIINHPMEVIASCARVPVENGHLASVVVELENQITSDEIIDAFTSFVGPEVVRALHSAPNSPIVLSMSPDRPQPKLDVWEGGSGHKAGMGVTVGRIDVKGNHVRFFLLSHNTIRGAAGGSILNAELAVSCELLR